jgi:cytochrome P450
MKTSRPDFMTRMTAPGMLSAGESVASADTVLLGGSETTATLLSGVTYYLLMNPTALQKLVQEIRSTFSTKEDITFASVGSLTYLLACLDEAFRLYPPVPGTLPRRTCETDTIGGKLVSPGLRASIPNGRRIALTQSKTDHGGHLSMGHVSQIKVFHRLRDLYSRALARRSSLQK